MILAFEGISCVGKTSTIKRLSDDLQTLLWVPELIVDVRASTQMNEGEIFRYNDMLKSSIIQSKPFSNILLDRYYLSTALCSPWTTYEDAQSIFNEMYKNYVEPDYWIYIDGSVSDSFKSSQKLRKHQFEGGPWSSLDNIRKIKRGYDALTNIMNNVIIAQDAQEALDVSRNLLEINTT